MSAPKNQIRAVLRRGDIKFRYGRNADESAAYLLCEAFEKMLEHSGDLIQQLADLGYDRSTLRLQMEKGGPNENS